MEYERRELTEWYDKTGRVRKRRLRQDKFHVSAWELNKVCDSLVKSLMVLQRAIVATSQRNPYLLE